MWNTQHSTTETIRTRDIRIWAWKICFTNPAVHPEISPTWAAVSESSHRGSTRSSSATVTVQLASNCRTCTKELFWGMQEWIRIKERWGVWEMRKWCENAVRWLQYNLWWWGCGLRSCNIRWCGMVMLIRVVLVVCNIMGKNLNVTSELEELFEGGIRTVFKERVLAWEDFVFFSRYSFSCIATKVTALNPHQPMPCSEFWKQTSITSVLLSHISWFLPVSPTPVPAHYTRITLITMYLILNLPTSLDKE